MKVINMIKKPFTATHEVFSNTCRFSVVKTYTVVTGLLASMASSNTWAVKSLGEVGTTAAANAEGLAKGALQLGAFAGIVLVIVAFLKGRNAKQQGESIGTYISMGIVGALLFSVPTVIGIFNQSVIGEDTSAGMRGKIITD